MRMTPMRRRQHVPLDLPLSVDSAIERPLYATWLYGDSWPKAAAGDKTAFNPKRQAEQSSQSVPMRSAR